MTNKSEYEYTCTATCEGCRTRSTWGGMTAGRKIAWCGRCQKSTYHIFITNPPKLVKKED